jgi:hypothetical protein
MFCFAPNSLWVKCPLLNFKISKGRFIYPLLPFGLLAEKSLHHEL